MYLLTKRTRPVPSASCRVHVELSWKTPRQRASLWAIIMPPPNEALADPSLPLYSALSLSLPLALSSPLLYGSLIRLITSPLGLPAWHQNFIPRYHIWATHLLQTKTHLTPTRSSLGYRRQELSSAVHPDPLLYRMSFILCLPPHTVQRHSHRVNCRSTRSAPYPELTTLALAQQASRGPIPGLFPLTSD